MSAEAEIVENEARAEAAYAAMYDAAPHNVKDHYEDACRYLAQAIEIATGLELTKEVARLAKRGEEIDVIYTHQFRYVGRS